MKNFTEVFNDDSIKELQKQLLFSGLDEEEIYLFILHSKPKYIHLNRGESVQFAGIFGHMMCVVYRGETNVYSIEYDGYKTLLKNLSSGDTSCQMYAMFDYVSAMVEFTASEDSDIILIDPQSIFIGEKSLAFIQQKILVNLLASQRQYFLALSEHLSVVSQRSVRDKILRFLYIQSNNHNSSEFEIPFSRDELANYLAVDRASLSRMLGCMKQEGLIDFRKNKFKILKETLYKQQD